MKVRDDILKKKLYQAHSYQGIEESLQVMYKSLEVARGQHSV